MIRSFVEEYAENYDWIPAEKQEELLMWFIKKQAIINHSIPLQYSFVKEIANSYKKQIKITSSEIRAAQSALSAMGIFVEFDWIGHREKYFLATKLDAEKQEEFLFCMLEDG